MGHYFFEHLKKTRGGGSWGEVLYTVMSCDVNFQTCRSDNWPENSRNLCRKSGKQLQVNGRTLLVKYIVKLEWTARGNWHKNLFTPIAFLAKKFLGSNKKEKLSFCIILIQGYHITEYLWCILVKSKKKQNI